MMMLNNDVPEPCELLFSSVCDPVMGDDGKFFVKPELLPVYREKVHSLL